MTSTSTVPATPRGLGGFAKGFVRGLDGARFALLDRVPGFLGDPLDDRLKRLMLVLESVKSDWDILPMRGLPCCDSPWMGHAALAYAAVSFPPL